MPAKKKQLTTSKQRFEILLEEIQSEVHVIAERYKSNSKKLDTIINRFSASL